MSITLEQARSLTQAALQQAAEMHLAVTVAVVDPGGALCSLARMDGAPPLSAQIAEAKAHGAAVWHRDGHAIAEVAEARPAFLAAVSQMTRLPLIPSAGGLVIRDGDAVIGAVGVSGATPDEDRVCAEAGLAALGRP